MDKDILLHQMTERFQELYGQALEAVEKAPDGQWIAASEWACRDTFQKLMQESYELALQARVDAHATASSAAFSPSGQRAGRRRASEEQGPT